MHVKAKKIAFGGMLLALTIIFMMLGSLIETGTLFLLAAASFFVGLIWREFGAGSGVAFWGAGVLLGLFSAPNKFYVITYAVMGLYILIVEIVGLKLGRMSDRINRKALFWIVKYVVVNLIFLPAVLLFQEVLFVREISGWMSVIVIAAGQVFLFLYDRAYEYFQGVLWNKMRGRFLHCYMYTDANLFCVDVYKRQICSFPQDLRTAGRHITSITRKWNLTRKS